MKNVWVIFLITLMSLIILKDWVTYAHFYLNQDYIANNLCVNRDKPLVMCSGNCYLESAIQANHNQEDDTLNTSLEDRKNNINFIYVNEISLVAPLAVLQLKSPILFVGSNYSFSFLHEIFHPPNFLVFT